jgi:hypothetical protein
MDEFNKLPLNLQLTALGNGSVKQCDKLISKNNWTELKDVPDNYKYLLTL